MSQISQRNAIRKPPKAAGSVTRPCESIVGQSVWEIYVLDLRNAGLSILIDDHAWSQGRSLSSRSVLDCEFEA